MMTDVDDSIIIVDEKGVGFFEFSLISIGELFESLLNA